MLGHFHCNFGQEKWKQLGANTVLYKEVLLPTRVVVVDLDHPYLLETNGAMGIYAALSHCVSKVFSLFSPWPV